MTERFRGRALDNLAFGLRAKTAFLQIGVHKHTHGDSGSVVAEFLQLAPKHIDA